MGEGWEPICKFLGKPIPKVPFPRLNDRAAIKAMQQIVPLKVIGKAKFRIILMAVALLVVVMLLAMAFQR